MQQAPLMVLRCLSPPAEFWTLCRSCPPLSPRHVPPLPRPFGVFRLPASIMTVGRACMVGCVLDWAVVAFHVPPCVVTRRCGAHSCSAKSMMSPSEPPSQWKIPNNAELSMFHSGLIFLLLLSSVERCGGPGSSVTTRPPHR